MTRTWAVRALAVVAAVTCVGAVTAQPASATSFKQRHEHDSRLVSDYGTGPEDFVEGGTDPRGGYAGLAHWYASGEHLNACDEAKDGLSIRAEVNYPDANTPVRRLATSTDPNGSAPGCGDVNLDLAEGTPVQIRVCIQNRGCTDWYGAKA